MTAQRERERRGVRAPDRTHIVLVPGFVGFDALGNLEYYAGVTRIFGDWGMGRGSPRAAIQYFDNFPTASVELRSRRLADWLAKRVARGEIGPDDRIALVGHSTGGLDIRKMVKTMANDPRGEHMLDGSCRVLNEQILERIDRIAFLSVPHYGTNIADFTCEAQAAANSLLKDAALGIELNRGPVAAARRFLTSVLPRSRSDLLLAVADALDESDEDRAGTVAHQTEEREARAQFSLWIDHMSKDFSVVRDLRSNTDDIEGSGSPAHESALERAKEMTLWSSFGITTRSYATIVPNNGGAQVELLTRFLPAMKVATRAVDLLAVPVNFGAELWPLPAVSVPSFLLRVGLPAASLPAVVGLLNRDPGIVFDLFQALCADAGGAFQNPNERTPDSIAPEVTHLGTGRTVKTSSLSAFDSDGIVNTLSMLWPYDRDHPSAHPIHLVTGDHGDIIGHYALRPAAHATPNGRKYSAYDIFQSHSGFGDIEFRTVWEDVFEFCTKP